MKIVLCTNCLCRSTDEIVIRDVEVGSEKGSQRDPYRDTVALCGPCEEALVAGNFTLLAGRHRNSATIEL